MQQLHEQNLYEELTPCQLISSNVPRVESSLSGQLTNLKTSNSLKCIKNAVQVYADKEKKYIRQYQYQYLRRFVKSVHNNLLVYSRIGLTNLLEMFLKKADLPKINCFKPKPIAPTSVFSKNIMYPYQSSILSQTDLKAQYRQRRSKRMETTQPLIQKIKALRKKSKPPKQVIERTKTPLEKQKLTSFCDQTMFVQKINDLVDDQSKEKRKQRTTVNTKRFHYQNLSLAKPHSRQTLSKIKRNKLDLQLNSRKRKIRVFRMSSNH